MSVTHSAATGNRPARRWRRRALRALLGGVAVLALVYGGLVGYFEYQDWRDRGESDADWPTLAAVATDDSGKAVTVGLNVMVSGDRPKVPHMESVAAADPSDPTRLFLACMHRAGGDGSGIAGFASADGGRTWERTLDRAAPPGHGLCDPALTFGPDGVLHFVHMQVKRGADMPLGSPGPNNQLRFSRSPDGGRTWEDGPVVERFIDRPWLAADTTPGPHRGNVYCLANISAPAFLRLTDGGRTAGPVAEPNPAAKYCSPGTPVVLADGTVLVGYWTHNRRMNPRVDIRTLRSTDGGQTLVDGPKVDNRWKHPRLRSLSGNLPDGIQMQLAAGRGPFADRVYCVWTDCTGTYNSSTLRVLVSVSPDKGLTWPPPAVLSEQPMDAALSGDYQAYMPSIAVNAAGVAAVVWYDRRGLPAPAEVERTFDGRTLKVVERAGWNARLRASADGGATWRPSVQVNAQPGRGDPDEVYHTNGVAAAADGRFHPAWVDDRTGTTHLWTAAVSVAP